MASKDPRAELHDSAWTRAVLIANLRKLSHLEHQKPTDRVRRPWRRGAMQCQWHGAHCWTQGFRSFAASPRTTSSAHCGRNDGGSDRRIGPKCPISAPHWPGWRAAVAARRDGCAGGHRHPRSPRAPPARRASQLACHNCPLPGLSCTLACSRLARGSHLWHTDSALCRLAGEDAR